MNFDVLLQMRCRGQEVRWTPCGFIFVSCTGRLLPFRLVYQKLSQFFEFSNSVWFLHSVLDRRALRGFIEEESASLLFIKFRGLIQLLDIVRTIATADPK